MINGTLSCPACIDASFCGRGLRDDEITRVASAWVYDEGFSAISLKMVKKQRCRVEQCWRNSAVVPRGVEIGEGKLKQLQGRVEG